MFRPDVSQFNVKVAQINQLVSQFTALGKMKMLFAGLGSVRIVQNFDWGLENAALSLGQNFQDLSHSFSLYGPTLASI